MYVVEDLEKDSMPPSALPLVRMEEVSGSPFASRYSEPRGIVIPSLEAGPLATFYNNDAERERLERLIEQGQQEEMEDA